VINLGSKEKNIYGRDIENQREDLKKGYWGNYC
jgi:hypothetical protein